MNKQKLESAKKLFFIALGIDMAVTVVVIASNLWGVSILKDIDLGNVVVDQSLISSLEFWDSFALVMLLTLIGVGLALVKWLNACYAYAKDGIGATGFKNESWTTAGWIVPILNLFKPYQIISEIYKAGAPTYSTGDDWKKESGSGLLLTWWIFWAVTHFIGWIAAQGMIKSSFRQDMNFYQSVGMIEVHIWICVVSLITAALWFSVADTLTRRLIQRKTVGFTSAGADGTCTPQLAFSTDAIYNSPASSALAADTDCVQNIFIKYGVWILFAVCVIGIVVLISQNRGEATPRSLDVEPTKSIEKVKKKNKLSPGIKTDEQMSMRNSVSSLTSSTRNPGPPIPEFFNTSERLAYLEWLTISTEKLTKKYSDLQGKRELLQTVWYESRRADLDPGLVLGMIETVSDFRQFFVDIHGARGYMAVNPQWVVTLGDGNAAMLFQTQNNLRYGCVVLRYYLDARGSDLLSALADYHADTGMNNGYIKTQSDFPSRVLDNMRHWNGGI